MPQLIVRPPELGELVDAPVGTIWLWMHRAKIQVMTKENESDVIWHQSEDMLTRLVTNKRLGGC